MSTALDDAALEAPARRPVRRLPEFAVALLVGVAVGVLAAIPFLQNHTFYYVGDNPESFLPLWHHLGEQLRSGRWPTMDPGGWTGGNYAAEASYALWNPVLLLDYVVVSLFDDLAAAAAVVQSSYLALLGIGAYLLCREYDARRLAAAVVALGVPLSGFTLFYEASGWPSGLAAFTWVAWFWWAARRQSRGKLWPLVTFVVGALGVTTGNPYAVLGIVVVLIGMGIELLVRRELGRLAGLLLTGICVGAVTALVFFPLLHTLPVSSREQLAGIRNDTFLVPHVGDLAASSAPTYLPAILNWGGAVVEKLPSTYFLWFAIPLLPWLRWQRVRRMRGPLIGLFVITAIFTALALGPSNLWLFRWPIRLIEYCYLGLAVLLARALSCGLATDHLRRRALGTTGIVAAGAYLSFATHPELIRMNLAAGVAVLVLVLGAIVAFLRAGPRAIAAVLVLGTLVVITYQTARLPLGVVTQQVTDATAAPTSVSQVERVSTSYRGTVLQLAVDRSRSTGSPPQTGELLFGNETLMTDHESVVRYSGIGFQKFYDALCMDYRGQVCPDALNRAWRPVAPTGEPLVDLLGVDTVVIDVHQFPTATSPPPGWSVDERDSLRTVWVRDRPSSDAGRLTWASPDVAITRDAGSGTSESVFFRADTPGQLVFARLAWPGYTAAVDGRPVQPRDDAAGLLTVPVPAGDHALTLTFRSPGERLGLLLLAAAALVTGAQTAVGIASRWRRGRSPQADENLDAGAPDALAGSENARGETAPAGALSP